MQIIERNNQIGWSGLVIGLMHQLVAVWSGVIAVVAYDLTPLYRLSHRAKSQWIEAIVYGNVAFVAGYVCGQYFASTASLNRRWAAKWVWVLPFCWFLLAIVGGAFSPQPFAATLDRLFLATADEGLTRLVMTIPLVSSWVLQLLRAEFVQLRMLSRRAYVSRVSVSPSQIREVAHFKSRDI